MTKAKTSPTFRGSELMKAASGTARDVLTVVLKPDRLYTGEETEQLTNKFLNKEATNNGRR